MKDSLKLSTFALVCVLLSTDGTEAGNDDLYSQLLRGNMPENQKEAIVKVVEKMPESSRELLVKCALKLIKDDMSGKDKKSILQILTNIQDADKEHFTNQALSIISEDFSYHNRIKTLEILANKKVSDLEIFTKNALSILHENLSQTDKAKIVETLSKNKLENLGKFLIQVKRVTSEDMAGNHLVSIMESLSKIKEKELEKFINQISKIVMIDDQLMLNEVAPMIKIVAKISPLERETFIEQVSTVSSGDAEGYYRLSIIKFLFEIKKSERASLVKDAIKFFDQGTEEYERESVLKALSEIKISDRECFINETLEFINQNSKENDKSSLIRLLAKVKPEQRQPLMSRFSVISKEFTNEYDQLSILKALVNTDPANYDNLLTQTRKLCSTDDNLPETIYILSQMPSSEREDLVNKILELSIGKTDQERHELLSVLQMVPFEDRDSLIKLSMIPGISIHEQASLIFALSRVDAVDRDSFLTDLFALTSEMGSKEKYTVIIGASFFEAKDRTAFVAQYKKLFLLENLDEDNRISLLDTFIEDGRGLNIKEIEKRIHRIFNDRILGDDFRRYAQILRTPSTRPIPERQEQPIEEELEGLDVHTGDRDELVTEGLNLLISKQTENNLSIEDTLIAYDKFREFLESWPDQQQKDKALLVLNNGSGHQGFGGFERANRLVNIRGLNGKILLGRLWLFAQQHKEGSEESEIKEAIITSLIRCIEDDGHVVCDPGKVQRLVVGVLQGRLQGVDIDKISQLRSTIADADLSEVFFTPERQAMDATSLRAEVARFMGENSNVSIEQLNRIVEGYITVSGL